MRWIIFIILLYAAAALQSVHLFALSTGDYARIEYIPLLAIFYALYAPEESAALCGFWCGLALDFTTGGQPLGTAAVPLALVAYVVVKIRLSIFREHLISQVAITILGIILFAFLSGLLRAITDAPSPSRSATFGTVFFPLSMNALYSGAVAPLMFWVLLRLRPILGFETARGRMQ